MALLPPVSWWVRCGLRFEDGGTTVPARRGDRRRSKAGSRWGGVLSLTVIVRNNTRGRETLYLDYEAYR